MQERIKDLIIQLKHVKEREGLSNAEIVRMAEKNNDYISLATVSRIMAEGSEESSFRYDSIKPIAKALLHLDASHLEGISDEERATKDVALIKEIELREKDMQIQQLKERVMYLEERVEYLKSQVSIAHDDIVRKDEQIAARDASIKKRDEMLSKAIDMLNQSRKDD